MALLNVVSQEMSNDTLVVRHHIDDLNTKSQLIVYESQEAIFFKNGQAFDLFPAGRHSLETANLPGIKNFFKGLFGGKTSFPCDIFFVNKVNVLDFLWGTTSPIDLIDPKYSLFIGVKANGQMGIRIADSRRFVIKVAGMMSEYSTDTLKRTVKGLMMSSIKESIAATIIEKGISILEITPRLTEISDTIQAKINSRIGDLGITVEHFNVNAICAGEDDLDALKEAKTKMLSGMNEANLEAYKIKVMGEARAHARAVEGYTYADERRFDVLEGAAKNESSPGGFVNMGVGLGVGTGIGHTIGKMASETLTPSPTPTPAAPSADGIPCSNCGEIIPAGAKFCMSCGKPRPTARFCPECGTKANDGAKFCMNCGTKLS